METNLDNRIEKIGSREAYLATGIALAIDIALVSGIIYDDGTGWLFVQGVWWKMIWGMILLVIAGQNFGKKCARSIACKRSWFLAGPIYALVTLAVAVWILGFSSFFIDLALGQTNAFAFSIYLVGLPFMVLFYSFIPVAIHGLWFGYRISNRVKKQRSQSKTENYGT